MYVKNKKTVDKLRLLCYHYLRTHRGIAQLVEQRSPKPRVVSSILTAPACGPVVQLVRTLACHARGRRFDPVPGRHIFSAHSLFWESVIYMLV